MMIVSASLSYFYNSSLMFFGQKELVNGFVSINFALLANLRVFSVSSRWREEGDTAQIIKVLLFPTKHSFNAWVNLLFLNTTFPLDLAKSPMTLENSNRLLLMLPKKIKRKNTF